MKISPAAFDLIVEEETGGEAYYRKTEQSTDWPGGASGVTIGIGYDCGYETAADIAKDWGDHLDPIEIKALQHACGIHGSPARGLAHELRSTINVPWDVALDVFRNRDVPKWEATVQSALVNTDQLSGDSFGALVSLAFNRGASFHALGPRYVEMRNIAALMRMKQFAGIPGEFLNMRRLWPKNGDLWRRRGHEAALFEKGLQEHLGETK